MPTRKKPHKQIDLEELLGPVTPPTIERKSHVFRQGCNSDGEPIRDVYVQHSPVNLACPNDGLTRQEFADECDINNLMAAYERTGVLSHINQGAPQYLDVTDVPDLQRAHDILTAATTAFMTLPASVRREFDNDPMKFVDFAEEPKNLDRMREWGLAPPAPPPIAQPAPPVGVSDPAPSLPEKPVAKP